MNNIFHTEKFNNKHVLYAFQPKTPLKPNLVTEDELGMPENIDESGVYNWEYAHVLPLKGLVADVFIAFMAKNPLNPGKLAPRILISATMPPTTLSDGRKVPGKTHTEIIPFAAKHFKYTKKGLNQEMSNNYMRTTNEFKLGEPINLEIRAQGKKLGLSFISEGKIRPAHWGVGGVYINYDGIPAGWVQKQTKGVVTSGELRIGKSIISLKGAIVHADCGRGVRPQTMRQENNWTWTCLNGKSLITGNEAFIVQEFAQTHKGMGHETWKRIILSINNTIIGEDPHSFQPLTSQDVPLAGAEGNFHNTIVGGQYCSDNNIYLWSTIAEDEDMVLDAPLISLTEYNSTAILAIARSLNKTHLFYTGRYIRHTVKGQLLHFIINPNGKYEHKDTFEITGIRENFRPRQKIVK